MIWVMKNVQHQNWRRENRKSLQCMMAFVPLAIKAPWASRSRKGPTSIAVSITRRQVRIAQQHSLAVVISSSTCVEKFTSAKTTETKVLVATYPTVSSHALVPSASFARQIRWVRSQTLNTHLIRLMKSISQSSLPWTCRMSRTRLLVKLQWIKMWSYCK